MDHPSAPHAKSQPNLVEMTGIAKAFAGVPAIRAADFALRKGEIHALVGENGAGKSTLIKILTGVHSKDRGEVRLDEQVVAFRQPIEAQRAGIATIYQEFTLAPSLPVAANIFLGQERLAQGLLDHRGERTRAIELLRRLGAEIDPTALVSALTVAQQQIVEIARALARRADVLVMDEPTAALAPQEVRHLFAVLRELAEHGMGIIFISHRLDEVQSIADTITVMRDGATITTRPTSEFTREQLIELMVGRPLDQEYPKTHVTIGEPHFEVHDLCGGIVRDVSFGVCHGEVLGLAGLMGAGRTEVVRLIFGADPRQRGEIRLNRRPLSINTPRDAIEAGLCLLTEDRRRQGLILGASVKDNFALPNLRSWSKLGWIDRSTERERFDARIDELNIRLAARDQKAEELSGGNQQKLLVARWLETDSEVVIFDEPTRGIDVGAKYEMYLLIGQLAAQGKSVIVISSELPELLGICDRILVMRQGRIAGEVTDVAGATQEQLMAMAV